MFTTQRKAFEIQLNSAFEKSFNIKRNESINGSNITGLDNQLRLKGQN